MEFSSTYDLLVNLVKSGSLNSFSSESWGQHFHVEMEGKDIHSLLKEDGYKILLKAIVGFCYNLRDEFQHHNFVVSYYPDNDEIEFEWYRDHDILHMEGKSFDAYLEISRMNNIFTKHIPSSPIFTDFRSLHKQYDIEIEHIRMDDTDENTPHEIKIRQWNTEDNGWEEADSVDLKQDLLHYFMDVFQNEDPATLSVKDCRIRYAYSAPTEVITSDTIKKHFEDQQQYFIYDTQPIQSIR